MVTIEDGVEVYPPKYPRFMPYGRLTVVPVSGTLYEWQNAAAVNLGSQKNVCLRSIVVQCTWTIQPNPLEVHVTLASGEVLDGSVANPVSLTLYGVILHAVRGSIELRLVAIDTGGSGTLGGKDGVLSGYILKDKLVKVEFEVTGGTVQDLSGWVNWEQT